MTRRSMQQLVFSALAARLVLRRMFILALGGVILALSACGPTTSGTGSPTATTAQATSTLQATTQPTLGTTPQATITPTNVTGYLIKVYFSKDPESLQNFDAVFPVNRISPTIAVATFSIQLLIAGPTLDERSAGYFSDLNSILTGPSDCNGSNPTGGGPDFTITLNMKGSTPEQGTATLQFCRTTQIPGEGAGIRIQAEIIATLTQFSNIKKVVILNVEGHCFADLKGSNDCLK